MMNTTGGCDSVQSVGPSGQPLGNHWLATPAVKPLKPELDLRAMDLAGRELKRYMCDQCLDEFLHESSLTTHLQRRSVRLSYLCDKCKANVIFFNRCALLSHIRSHHQNRDHIERTLSQVSVQPIDLSQLFAANCSHTANLNNNSTHNNGVKDSVIEPKTIESIQSGYHLKQNTIYRHSDESNRFIQPKVFQMKRNECKTVVNTSSDVISKKYVIKKTTNSELKCSQCNHSFNSLSTREQHLSDRQPVVPLNQCKLCPTICATNCSQSIHNSLHAGTGGHADRVCPECGAKLDESQPKDLMNHLMVNCLHFSRRLIYKCLFCSDKVATLPAMTKHIKSDHTTHHYRCSQCLSLLASDSDLTRHQTETECKDSKALVSLKCPVCSQEVNSLTTYSDHLTSHRKKFSDFAYFVFVCLDCDQSFANKIELKTHLNTVHINTKSQTQDKDFLTQLIEKTTAVFKLKVGLNCVKHPKTAGDDSFAANNTTLEKRKISDLNGKSSETMNDLSTKRLKTNNESCVKSNSSDHNKSANDTQKAAANDNSLKCNECDLSFPFVQTLKRHLILEHRIHDVESYMSNTYVEIAVTSVATEPQLPKEVGEERLSQILDSEDSKDTICPICCQSFADSKELKIHGRVHGMAFIKSCQKKSL